MKVQRSRSFTACGKQKRGIRNDFDVIDVLSSSAPNLSAGGITEQKLRCG
jgi:hypothetical protein